jgi:hypothetical protein
MSSKNHRLLIMGPRRDIVCEMMAQLDEVSQDVPEGFYLQFCGHLMRLHELGDYVTRTSAFPPQQRVRRGIPARIRTEAERQADPEDRRADRAARDQIYRDLFGDDVEYRPTSPARHPRRL